MEELGGAVELERAEVVVVATSFVVVEVTVVEPVALVDPVVEVEDVALLLAIVEVVDELVVALDEVVTVEPLARTVTVPIMYVWMLQW